MSVGIGLPLLVAHDVGQHVLAAGKVSLEAVVSPCCIENLVAHDTLEEGCQAPVAVVQRVVPSVDELRLCVAHLRLVAVLRVGSYPLAVGILVSVGLNDHVAALVGSLVRLDVVDEEDGVAVAVVASVLESPERAERFTLHDALRVAPRRETADVGVALVDIVDAEGSVRQLVHLVVVVRQVDGCLPLEVVGLHGDGVQRELYALVGDVAHVGANPVDGIDIGRNGIVPDQVAGLLVVVFEATVETSAEEGEVETDVEHCRAFPLQVGIGVVLCLDAVHRARGTVAVDVFERVGVQSVGGDGVVGTEAHGVTAHTVAEAQLELFEDVLVLHKALLGDVPCCRDRGEGSPAVVFAEHRRTVAADGCLQDVARGERVVGASIEGDVADGLLRFSRHVGNAVDVVGKAEVPEASHVIVEVVHRHAEAVVRGTFLPRVTGHQPQLVHLVEGLIEVAVGLEGLVVAHVGFAVSASVVPFFYLCLVCVVPVEGVLAAVVRVVGIPNQSVYDLQRSLGDILNTSPFALVAVFVYHRQGVVVVRTDGRVIPRTVAVADRVGGRIVVHGVEHTLARVGACEDFVALIDTSAIVHGHALELTLHGVQTDRNLQTVFQDAGGEQRACIHTVHASSFHHTLTVHIVDRTHVLRLLVAAGDAHVMVVRETGAQHFVLPVGVAAAVLFVTDEAAGAQLAGRSHVECLQDVVKCDVCVIGDVGLAFLSALRGDDDHTVGSLRTVDGCCRGVAEHVDRLDVVGCHHRDVHTGNAVDDIVGLHGLTLAERRGTAQCDARCARGVATGGDRQTSHLTLQHRSGIVEDTLVEVFGLHGGDGARHVLTAHRAITHDDHLVQRSVLFLHDNVEALSADSHLLCLIADVAHLQRLALSHTDSEVAVHVGDGTIVCSLLHDAHADEGLALCVLDRACHLLCKRREAVQQEQRKNQSPRHALLLSLYVHKLTF